MQEDQEEHIIEIEDENPSEEVDAVEDQQEPDPAPAIEVSEEAPKEVSKEAPEKEAKSGEELAEYSEGVQRRIRKLTAKFREEERQREAALQYAEAVKKQNEDLQTQLRSQEASYVDEMGGRLNGELEAAKAKLKTAIETDDSDGIFEAQQMVSRITVDQARHADAKLRVERQPEYTAPQVPQQAPVAQAAAEPDPKAQAWAERNTWFGDNDTMTYAAFGIHRRLVEEEGFDPTTDEYYNELDNRIRGDFPQKFEQPVQEQEAPKKAAKPRVASAESSATRSSNKGRRTVKLSPSQVSIAKKLGVPLEEYAKFVKE
jgi:hypothetical protein